MHGNHNMISVKPGTTFVHAPSAPQKEFGGKKTGSRSKYGFGSKSGAGFTLIEILLVVAIVAILASIVILAINPGRHFAKTRDAQRLSDVNTILNAIHQYALDNEGNFPGVLTTNHYEICQTGASCGAQLYDLSELTNNAIYLVSIPIDPQCSDPVNSPCDTNGTGYHVGITASGRVNITADGEDIDINVTR